MAWKLSQYTVVRKLADRGLAQHALVFNTLSSRSLTVQVDDWREIEESCANSMKANPRIDQSIAKLVEMGILIENEVDERKQWSEAFDRARYAPRRIYPILAVTTACNIGCTYCYEEGVVGRTMTPQVIAGVLNWLKCRIVRDGIQEIYPALFGGEPLMYPGILMSLMDGFNEICRLNNVTCSYSCSSNGVLMTEKLASQLASRQLNQIQISLDGPEEIHNQRRIGKRGEPSYETALSGIKCAVKHIANVTVKINFDRHNRAHVARLFDALVDENLGNLVDVKLEAIAEQFKGSQVAHDPAYVIQPTSPELADAYHELTLEAQDRGIKVTRDTAHTTPCMFSSHHGVIIGPDGNIFKCISFVGRQEYKVGTVFDEVYDQEEYARQMDTLKRLSDCFDESCAYVPVCAGGCAYESAVRTGRYDLRFCTKEQLAEYHYKRHLIRYQKQLAEMGMRPLTAAELSTSSTACSGQQFEALDTSANGQHGVKQSVFPMTFVR